MPWLFEDEASAGDDARLRLIERAGAVVPSIWILEVANTLGLAERRNRITPLQVAASRSFLQALPIEVDHVLSWDGVEALLELMGRHSLSAYDAAYLDLALRWKLPLASRDAALCRAAVAAGVGLLDVPGAGPGHE